MTRRDQKLPCSKGWLPFPNHHFGYPAFSFRQCIPKRCLSFWTIQNRLTVFFSSPDVPQAAQAFPIHQSFTRSGAVLGEAVFWRGDDCGRRGWLKKTSTKLAPNNMFWSCLHVDLDIAWETLTLCAYDFLAREWTSKFSMEPIILMYQNFWLSIIFHPEL